MAEASGEGPTPTRVLVVDDHPMVAAGLIAVVSEEADLSIVGPAGSLREMRAIVATESVDVVLLDLQLPDGDGIKGIGDVKQLAPSCQVVILTAHASDSALLQAIQAGCSGFLIKDAPIDQVVEAIRSAARGEVLVSPKMLARLLPKLRRQSSTGAAGAPFELTTREEEVLQLIGQGLTNALIAERLVVSVHTVRNHVQSLLSKLGAHSKLEALAIAMQAGLLDQDSHGQWGGSPLAT